MKIKPQSIHITGKRSIYSMAGIFLIAISNYAGADIIDPAKHIRENGYHSVKISDDGKTKVYTFTERANSSRISGLESDIAALPKNIDVQKACDSMRGSAKALLIQQSSIAYDIAATNYGYSGSTVACVLKYMYENKVGTQLIFINNQKEGLFMVFVID